VSDLDERRKLIGRLFGAANKQCDETRMDAYLETLKRMETPRLIRAVEHVLDGIQNMTDPEDYKPPTAGGLWKVLKKLRALPPPLELRAAEPKYLPFDTNANQLLMAYLWDKHAPNGMTRYAPDSPNPKLPGPITRARTAILVKWKNAWARDMREDREAGGKLDGKASWIDCMARAEAEIDRLIALEQVAA
jgi:hypothetical protein